MTTPRPYDFRQPSPLADEPRQMLTAWLRAVCALAGRKWAKHLPFAVDLSLRGLEVLRGEDALGRLPDEAVGYRVVAGQGQVTGLVVVPRPVLLALVGGVLGDSSGQLPEDRELTVVEDSVSEFLFQEFVVTALQEAWPAAAPLTFALGAKEPHPKYGRTLPAGEVAVVGAFTLAGPFGEQAGYWLWPQAGLLAALLPPDPNAPPPDRDVRSRLEALARQLPVPVSVSLGAVKLTLSQVAELRAGDLVVLNQRIADPLTAEVTGKPKYRVWCGRVGSRLAFQIDSHIEG